MSLTDNNAYNLGRKIQILKASIEIIEELIHEGKWNEAFEMADCIKIMGE